MSYYIGTYEQCSEYDKEVTAKEKYVGDEIHWMKPVAKPDGSIYAIKAHPKYPSDMQILENVNEWFQQDEEDGDY